MYGQRDSPNRPGKRSNGDAIIRLSWRCMASPLNSRSILPASASVPSKGESPSADAKTHEPAFMPTSLFKGSLSPTRRIAGSRSHGLLDLDIIIPPTVPSLKLGETASGAISWLPEDPRTIFQDHNSDQGPYEESCSIGRPLRTFNVPSKHACTSLHWNDTRAWSHCGRRARVQMILPSLLVISSGMGG